MICLSVNEAEVDKKRYIVSTDLDYGAVVDLSDFETALRGDFGLFASEVCCTSTCIYGISMLICSYIAVVRPFRIWSVMNHRVPSRIRTLQCFTDL